MPKPTKLSEVSPDAKGMPYREWQLKYGHRLRTEAERIDDERQAARMKQELKFGDKQNGQKGR
jgi:hypothetical protein